MINEIDFIVGREFWYSNFKLNSKFKVSGKIDNLFRKIRIVLDSSFLAIQDINNNNNYLMYIGSIYYLSHNKVKSSILSQLYYTEQEAIEDWNNKIEEYRIRLNKLLDSKIFNVESNVKNELLKTKDYIGKFKENINNLDKTTSFIEFDNDLYKSGVFYKVSYGFINPNNDIYNYTSYFSFSILKLREETDNSYIFNIYHVKDSSKITMNDLEDYCRKNKSVYTLTLNKKLLKKQIETYGIYTGVSNSFIIDIENKYNNFIENIKECYNNIDNYLLSLKK